MTRTACLATLAALLLATAGQGQGYDPAKVGRKARGLYERCLAEASEGEYARALATVG